jgi:hypothetical protein
MGTQAQAGGGARSWRARLQRLLHDVASEESAEPAAAAPGPDTGDTRPGAQASLDQLLREASEARHPREEEERGT